MGFWDKHLPAAGEQPQHYPAMPAAQPVAPPVVQRVPPQYAPDGSQQQGEPIGASLTEALQSEAYTPVKAIAHRTETGTCPGCGSANWYTGASSGTPVKPHCYDCGYPFVQAGSGMGALGAIQSTGPVRPAAQAFTPNPDPKGY